MIDPDASALSEDELFAQAAGTAIDPSHVAETVRQIDNILPRIPASMKKQLFAFREQLIEAPAYPAYTPTMQRLTGVPGRPAVPTRYVSKIGHLFRILCEWRDKLPPDPEFWGYDPGDQDGSMEDYVREHTYFLNAHRPNDVHVPLLPRLGLSWDDYVSLTVLNNDFGPELARMRERLQAAMEEADPRCRPMLRRALGLG